MTPDKRTARGSTRAVQKPTSSEPIEALTLPIPTDSPAVEHLPAVRGLAVELHLDADLVRRRRAELARAAAYDQRSRPRPRSAR